jgi:uncharacterized protein YndB with AHSA1/START domain
VLRIEQEVMTDASVAKVFEALTRHLAAWWGAPYLVGDAPRDLVVEPRIGGRVYEDWGGGNGALWATVTSFRKPVHIEWTGRIGMGGALVGVVGFTLQPTGKGTILKLTHHAAGEVTPETERGYAGGWQDLLGTRLRAFTEKGERLGLHKGRPAARKSTRRK